MGARGRGWDAIGAGLKESVEVSSPVTIAIEYGKCVIARRQSQIVPVCRLLPIIRPFSVDYVGAVVYVPSGLRWEAVGSDLRDYGVIACDGQ